MQLPKELVKNILSIYGPIGREWLNNLPYLLSHYAKKWQLTVKDCFNNASFNVVAEVILDNGHYAILKCGVPSKEFMNEVAALQHFNGIGSVKLLDAEAGAGIMLLERLVPGTLLEEIPDETQRVIASVELIQKLHRPCQETTQFPSLANWFQGFQRLYQYFQGGTGPFPKLLIERASAISQELLMSMGSTVLLHGDLHYANILLSDEYGWVAIDPKGVIGEREYEIPFPRLKGEINESVIKRRLDQFIEISGFDRTRVWGWAFCKAVLAAWWSFEDQGEIWQPFLRCADALKI
ncbi:aminoglycoside/hydroxyurea antibiotic resistance kinase [Candidatus Rickettsiella viridis]|uniref:Aminoglycoside/hydroxyurea antibiotic resistance kinase n=1 Tax=Candidatus Rickettsiella viridis TaxID=676208 RepID=A0A2Z5UWR2_9COXI|nr:aminoglycoside phosphotransferase family protein [Candidatus Rickettsiella viridis]BBB15370.1 aminoglycoside/hydroxyurea antibiotic resistance kinase [Candidatus Rickettsiella viridis]